MTNLNNLSFEEKLQAAVWSPQPRQEFLASLRARLVVDPPQPISLCERLLLILRRPAWVTVMVGLLLGTSLFIAGPQHVFAAMQRLLGYIPGVGIVDNNTPIRFLAEPVTVTKEGITITITSAVLTGNGTHIEYSVFGVPESAYSIPLGAVGCTMSDYLRLPDGTQLGYDEKAFHPVPTEMDFLPVPEKVDEAVLVIPCIVNTMPGTVPENWEMPMRFVPAPSNLTVMPVIELSPSPLVLSTDAEASPVSNSDGTVTPTVEGTVIVQKFIETSDGYILMGVIHPENEELSGPDGKFEVIDATGKIIDHTYPQDVSLDVVNASPDDIPWATQFKSEGLVYPLTISFPRVMLYQPDPAAAAEFEFDAGANPQTDQELVSNQEIQLLGHTLKLVSVSVSTDSRNVYDFMFQVDSEVDSINVEIEGYTPNGWGGGGKMDGQFNRSLSFPEIPTGKLKVIVSGLTLIEKQVDWQGQWSPTTPRTDLPADSN